MSSWAATLYIERRQLGLGATRTFGQVYFGTPSICLILTIGGCECFNMYNAVISAANHPDPYNPYIGLFNSRSVTSLAQAGVKTDVVSPRPIAPPAGPYSEYGNIPSRHSYSTYEVHYPRFTYLIPQKLFKYTVSSRSIANRLPAYLNEHFDTPDICHAGHIHYDGYGMLPYCREHDLPLTVMGRGKILNNYDNLSWIGQQKIAETLNYADGILCVSNSLADIANDIVDEPKAVVLPNGAQPSRYPTQHRAEIKRELGIPQDTAVVLFCGGYTKRKGINEICEAVEDVQAEDVQFVFVGHYGDLRTELRTALRQSSQDSYKILWEVPPLALRRWFAVADIFMLPSHAEGRPNTVYEAMASETAVVASAVSGIPEQVNDGETGILIPPKDPPALASALNRLLEDPTQRARMGAAGRERLVSKGWTWKSHGMKLAKIHESIIEDGHLPAERVDGQEITV